MCARFSLYATPAQIAKLLEIDVPDLPPRYNIAPTQMVLGAIEKDGARQIREFRWGLIPSWAKDPKVGNKMINARSEGVMEKPSFRNAFLKRRCLIPTSGFFEWKHETVEAEPVKPKGVSLFEEFDIPERQKPKTVKRPYFISLNSGEPFAFAGLYEYWRDSAGELVRTCTILTTHPNDLIAPLHDRMPVIIPKAAFDTWMDCENHAAPEAESLLQPLASSKMHLTPVSSLVNDPNNESPEVVEPLGY